ncbi:MAG TPA: hypothetical protein VGD60_06730 [Candidatus Acidoferrales bacterium]
MMRTRELVMRWMAAFAECGGGLVAAMVLAVCAGVCVPVAGAQDAGAIRVESDQVLVPTTVFDKKLYALTSGKKHKRTLRYMLAHDPHFWDTIAVRDLTAKDFRVLEDGQEQPIAKVTFEAPDLQIVGDTVGQHAEMTGIGGGKWTYPDLAGDDHTLRFPWPKYVIAYSAKKAEEGRCHQIEVKVNRPNMVVWARSEYCSSSRPTYDPLQATEFGRQMEQELTAGEPKLELAVQTFAVQTEAGRSRVNITMQFPWRRLHYEMRDLTLLAKIGTMGVMYSPDGTVAGRFSDFACCDYGNERDDFSAAAKNGVGREVRGTIGGAAMVPERYDTQVDLAPGKYELRVVVSDGEKFGRATIPLTMGEVPSKAIEIGEIVLCSRVRKVSTEYAKGEAPASAGYVPLVSRGVEYTPAGNEVFTTRDTMYAYFQVNAPGVAAATPGQLKIHFRIVRTKSDETKMDFAEFDAAPYATAGSALVSIGRGIELAKLATREYRLEVQARDAQGAVSEWRKADFSVTTTPARPQKELEAGCVLDVRCY